MKGIDRREWNMTGEDFKLLEERLDVTLPEYYKSTMLKYQFNDLTGDSVLFDHYGDIICQHEYYCVDFIKSVKDNRKPLIIGNNWVSTFYFIDNKKKDSKVYIANYDPPWDIQIYSESWGEFLEFVKERDIMNEAIINEPIIDESSPKSEKKHFWQFWK